MCDTSGRLRDKRAGVENGNKSKMMNFKCRCDTSGRLRDVRGLVKISIYNYSNFKHQLTK